MALAYGPGAKAGAASLGAAGAAKVVVLGDENAPAVTLAAAAGGRGEGCWPHRRCSLRPRPTAATWPPRWSGLLGVPAFGPVRAAAIIDGRLRVEQATLQGTVDHGQRAGR